MEKLKMHSPDFTEENIAKLAELFPNCVTEAEGEDGEVKAAIDFDLLRQELSDHVVEGPRERYRLDWPGKKEALLAANAPIAKTLRPCREESVDFDTTKNLFIEGDNLEALKLLQENYLGKVKMIYIDPPYNTGKDFIYLDDFSESASEYLEKSNQVVEGGERLIANSETNGRFHSDWLSMMYSRLRLARNLLTSDGVVFISIDDGEVSNLRKLCDEVFGEDNFTAQIIWKKRNTPPNDKKIAAQHDYILAYTRSGDDGINLRERSKDQIARYKNPDKHKKGPWVAGDLTANVKGGRYVESLNFPIRNPRTKEEFYPGTGGNWRFNREKVEVLLKNDEIYFGADDLGRPKLKRFLSEVKSGTTWTTLWDFAPFNTSGSKEMLEIFGESTLFENPKPVGLLEHLIKAGSSSGDIVLDFFAGSSSCAHAALKVNAEDGCSRRFMMVQIPEHCEAGTVPNKAGYTTIAEIAKERIRRAGAKIKADNADKSGIENLDTGFRVLKIDTSNMRDVYYAPDAINQDDLFTQTDNIKPDRSGEDLLFQVLLDWGVDLSLPISEETIEGKTVFFVDDNALAACFETGVTEALIKALAARTPLRAVFRDAGFADDSTRINAEEIFKVLSPATEVKAI